MKKALFILLFLFNFQGWAHEVRPAFLQIIQTSETSYNVFWKVPSMGEGVPKINPVFAPFFIIEELNRPNQLPGSVIYSYKITSKELLQGTIIRIEGLNKTLIDALVTIDYLNGEKVTFMLQPDKDSEVIPGESSTYDVIKTYTVLGVEHILEGIDHLLFVFALLLITVGFRKLIKTVTAFTIAHSITLSLSAMGIIGLPGAPVEAVIALSIVFLAVELVKYYKGEVGLTVKYPWIVAFTFGLLHGFGFAGALADIGLPQTDIPLALLFFNVGVEIGQIVFILAVLIFIYLMKKIKTKWPTWIQKATPYAIGSIASFWLVERVIAFWS